MHHEPCSVYVCMYVNPVYKVMIIILLVCVCESVCVYVRTCAIYKALLAVCAVLWLNTDTRTNAFSHSIRSVSIDLQYRQALTRYLL